MHHGDQSSLTTAPDASEDFVFALSYTGVPCPLSHRLLLTLTTEQGPWVTHGGGLENRREGPLGSKVSAATVNSLALRWSLNVSNEITATPTVADGMLYFPVWTDGNIYAVDALSGLPFLLVLYVFTKSMCRYLLIPNPRHG